ncbi:hypothetical protein [Nocardioides sp. W7]|uniref:hypothetical protein n=1 Tax=Nocardioides sp. W7 TaxID=2931390 RepID=UPI001FD39628|nr:hypothetical protein [Nocardioides sp. W7]
MAHLTGRQLMLIAGCALFLATLTVGIYGLVSGLDGGNDRPARTSATPAAPITAAPPAPAATLAGRSLPRTTDPVAYARAVATSLFDWDTSTGFLPTDYTAAVLADADPSGQETPGLIDDVTSYLPTVDQWLDLAAMEVAQSIEIENAVVPDSWAAALTQANGQLRPGTTAITITGTRHRTGVWSGETAESSYPVSFTVFLACRPAFERCHVLRLSQLDNPLR